MIIGYPQPGKSKSLAVVGAFVAGARGHISRNTERLDENAEPVFYGLVGIEHLLRQAIDEGRTFYYGDNGFFDRTRGTHFRFARDALQFSGEARPSWERWNALNIEIRAWRQTGEYVLVVEQSEHFMRLAGEPDWLERTLNELPKHTDKPIVRRTWTPNKKLASASLHEDLRGAWALVTYSSSAAVEALIDGVPVFVGAECAASPMASGSLENIESPETPKGRKQWAAGLAGLQWTLEELREGVAWRTLNAGAGSATP